MRKNKLFLIVFLILAMVPLANADWYFNLFTGTLDYYEPVSGADMGDLSDVTFTLTTRGDIIYRGATAWNNLAKGTAGMTLIQGANDPAWGTLGLTYGGTGISSAAVTNGQLLIGNTTGNLFALAGITGTANQVVVTNGASSITLSLPQDIAAASTPTFGLVTGTAGFIEGAIGTATENSAFTVDWTVKKTNQVTITGVALDITFTNPSGPCTLVLYVIQGDGDDTIDWANEADILFPGGVDPVLTVANGACLLYTF